MIDATSENAWANSEAKHSIAAAATLAAAPEETASRHGHHSRLRSIPAAVGTGND